MTELDSVSQLVDRLLAAEHMPGSIFIYPHVSIDGDALGSMLALANALGQLNIRVRMPLDEEITDRLLFLPELDRLEPFDESLIAELASDQQFALLVDCSDSERTGRRKALSDLSPQIGVIDHHVSGGQSGFLRWIDPKAAAVGEMVYDLIVELEKRKGRPLFNQTIGILLMTAIISDTGGFSFSNVSARTFRTAAALMEHDIDLRTITYYLFDLTSQERMRLMGRVFADAQFHYHGRLAIALVDQELLTSCGADDADLEGVIGHLRNVAGVEVAFLIRELPGQDLRVNIRSSEEFNAAEFARLFGGGGHPRAAGLQFQPMPLDKAAALIINKAGEWL
ncbi:MAG: DHH family phosphoesterase [Saccharofermentanales bacterium]|jgi:phosphoesterase RecJ-like protein